MSLFPSFKQSVAIPLQDAATAMASAAITSAVSTVVGTAIDSVSKFTQPAADFTAASTQKKQAEVIVKFAAQGNAGKFSNLTPRKIDISSQNGSINVIDSATKNPISTVGSATTQSVPADLANALVNPEDKTASFKVRLTAPYLDSTETIVLDVMPTIDESRSASYDAVPIIHHPGEILKYRSTSSRNWGIQTRLISRNPEEAAKNLAYVNIIRSWVMPYYGAGTAITEEGSKLGAPPPIITLEGYGEKMIGPITCVLESYSWNWPNDVDYIRTEGDNQPFPAIISISLTLKEALSPAEYSGFDLTAYREGRLSGSYIPVTATPTTNSTSNIPAAANPGNSSKKDEASSTDTAYGRWYLND
jgi:hypothetical protein